MENEVSQSRSSLVPHTEGCFPGNVIRSEYLKVEKTKMMPTWTMNYAIYSVVLHLADSIPVTARNQWIELRKHFSAMAETQSRELTDEEIAILRRAYDDKIENYLNSGYGQCLLREPSAAGAIESVLEHDNGVHYALHAWTIMPNHLHVILQLGDGIQLTNVINGWKRVSAHTVNRAVGRRGELWMDGAYTRIIRTAEEYRRQLSYLWNNPVAAGLSAGFLQRRYVSWDAI